MFDGNTLAAFPTGLDGAGLPIALLLSGGPGRVGELLTWALAAKSMVRGVARDAAIAYPLTHG